jgi:D-amino-acid oxidase
MTRAVKVCPELTGGKGVEGLSIIRHGVGLRPYRTGGVRVEKEKIDGEWISGFLRVFCCCGEIG